MPTKDIYEAVSEFEDPAQDAVHPLRSKMRPTNADGFRDAWTIVEQLWGETVARARTLPPELLHESVNGEWSFIQTLRHLLFATDSWIGRMLLGDPNPWHPLDLPSVEIPDGAEVPCDRVVRPSLDEVMELRVERMAMVREVVNRLSDESMNDLSVPVHAPGWPGPISVAVYDALLCILNEEWQHRLYAERDLDLLVAQLRDAAFEREWQQLERSEMLQALLDDDDLDGVLALVTLDEIAITWCRYNETEHQQFEELGSDWWAIDIFFNSELFQRNDLCRALLLKLVEFATEPVLGNVGAGPLENYVSNDEDDLRWLETECVRSPKLRIALSGVWCAGFVSEENMNRLDAAAGVPLARPKAR